MRRQRTDPAAIEAEIARIPSLALDALRRRWRAVFGRMPPAALSKDLLGRMIACRLQERAFGGLDRESLRFLDRGRCSGATHSRVSSSTSCWRRRLPVALLICRKVMRSALEQAAWSAIGQETRASLR